VKEKPNYCIILLLLKRCLTSQSNKQIAINSTHAFITNALQRNLEQKLLIEVLPTNPPNSSPGEKLKISTLPGIEPGTSVCEELTVPQL